MSFQDTIQAGQKYFPKLQVKYKDTSPLMKFFGTLLFFNKKFMTEYTTTIGNTIYFPSQSFVKVRGVSASVVLLHELVHMSDSKKMSRFVFSLGYLFPQILGLLFFPMLFVSWKIALFFLAFFLPVPSFFRMRLERRAYISSLYTLQQLSLRLKFNPLLDKQKDYFLSQFKGSYYYFMWPFDLTKPFDEALVKVRAGERPYEDKVFDMIDDLITKV